MSKIGRHAVVMGGSMAGLLASRVLAERFERVTLIERDRLGDAAEPRKGVPQGHHVHALLPNGGAILETLFPGLRDELIAGGATAADLGGDMRWWHYGGYRANVQSGLTMLFQTRPLLESAVRQRVRRVPNLTILDEHELVEVSASEDRATITGVVVRPRAGGEPRRLEADLVVDATGRGSRTPRLLESLGFSAPRESEVKMKMAYASRVYRRQAGDLPGAKFFILSPTAPAEKRLAVLFPVEGNRWLVTMGGWLDDHAPTDDEGWLAFAESLPAREPYELMRHAEPLSGPVTFKFPSNVRRHYEKLKRLPERLVVIGDAMASFNPAYGQGMTIAALESRELGACLDAHGLDGLPHRYHRRAAGWIERAWMLAAGEDFRYPEVEGKRPPETRVVNAYVGRVHQATLRDPVVTRAFLDVMNLTKAPPSMFHPRLLMRVLFGGKRMQRALPASAV